MKRLVSVILTVYNEEKLLKQSLGSLLSQTYKPLEIIVVDDGSTDASMEIAGNYPVKLIKQPHAGCGIARNRGAKEAKGEIVVFCDGDIVYKNDYLTKLVLPILEDRAIGTFHKGEMIDNSDNFWSRGLQINDRLPRDRKISVDFPSKSDFFRAIRKDIFLKAGGYDDIGYLDDRSLYQKIKRKSLAVREAICWHTNPESLSEVFGDARWRGKSLAKQSLFLSFLQYFPLNTLRRIVLDTLRSREPFYFLFKIVFDAGILLGLTEGFLGRSLAK